MSLKVISERARLQGLCRASAEVRCVLAGRALEEMFLCYGARIGYWRGKIEGVQDDLHVSHFLKTVTKSLDWSRYCVYHQI